MPDKCRPKEDSGLGPLLSGTFTVRPSSLASHHNLVIAGPDATGHAAVWRKNEDLPIALILTHFRPLFYSVGNHVYRHRGSVNYPRSESSGCKSASSLTRDWRLVRT